MRLASCDNCGVVMDWGKCVVKVGGKLVINCPICSREVLRPVNKPPVVGKVEKVRE